MTSETEQVDWSTSEVKDGTLSVKLTSAPAKPWRRDFQRLLALLDDDGQGGWGQIVLTKRRLEVADVAEGSEDDLRHFLESAILQANSDLGTASAAAEDAPETRDRRMTATFRRFGLSAG